MTLRYLWTTTFTLLASTSSLALAADATPLAEQLDDLKATQIIELFS